MPRFLPSSRKGLLHETSNKMKQKRKINQTRLEQTRQKSRNLTSGRRKKMGSGAAWLPSKRLRRRQPFTIIMYIPSALLTVAVVLCFELWAQLMSLKIYQWTCSFVAVVVYFVWWKSIPFMGWEWSATITNTLNCATIGPLHSGVIVHLLFKMYLSVASN